MTKLNEEMQQQIDLIIFIISHSVLIYWCVLTFRHKGGKTLSLGLSKKQLIALFAIEVGLFIVMFLNYEMHKSPDVADSFAWHYSLVYARGVLPIAGLSSADDRIFNFKDPVFACLLSGLIVDYIILLLCTKISDAVKKGAATHGQGH